MKDLQLNISITPELYLKNPGTTDLGNRIISEGIEMILEMGFESFNFKKLGSLISTSEGSIYRYFESKHQFLAYITCWYWSWMEYGIVMSTTNINPPQERLKIAVNLLLDSNSDGNFFPKINVGSLEQIIITESIKTFHTKNVDSENKKGFFKVYKRVVRRVGDIILEINPTFRYPHTLISTVIEGAHHQRYFADHLPSLTEINEPGNSISDFYTTLILKTIN